MKLKRLAVAQIDVNTETESYLITNENNNIPFWIIVDVSQKVWLYMKFEHYISDIKNSKIAEPSSTKYNASEYFNGPTNEPDWEGLKVYVLGLNIIENMSAAFAFRNYRTSQNNKLADERKV